MSTEQRDKAAVEEFPEQASWGGEPITVTRTKRSAFSLGWSAHAATMPDRGALAKNIRDNAGYNLGMSMSEGESEFLADAVLALLNKEGEE